MIGTVVCQDSGLQSELMLDYSRAARVSPGAWPVV